MEFVQLQINYLDWDSEGVQSRKCYEVATRHGVPVIVMEPVKGGTLANVPEAVEEMFKRHQPDLSVASWAVRFTANLDNVFMVLSGMSNREQLLDNTSYMMDCRPLSEAEQEIIRRAVGFINGSIAIPCTGCAYCVDGCPVGIPIPQYFSLYNADKQEIPGKSWTPQESYYVNLTKEFGAADQCLECGHCEQVCPQHLPIIQHLKEVAEHYKDA
jgi:predicted aldo/keto reductase-like oxidoreductase